MLRAQKQGSSGGMRPPAATPSLIRTPAVTGSSLHRGATQAPSRVDTHEFLLSIDYGTKTLALAGRIAERGAHLDPTRIHEILFRQRDFAAPQIIAFRQSSSGVIHKIWGEAALEAFRKNRIPGERVVDLLKLPLYQGVETSSIARRLTTQLQALGTNTLELLAWHLEQIVIQAKKELKNSITIDAHDIDELPMKVFLSVPQMWKASSRVIMLDAAKRAGIRPVDLVFEAECAAAHFAHQIMASVPQGHVTGDELIIFDIGGGTGDLIRIRYVNGVQHGAKVILQNVHSEGVLCGSEFVGEEFRDCVANAWANQHGGLEAVCEYMEMSEETFLKLAVDGFDTVKHDFNGVEGSDEVVEVRNFAAPQQLALSIRVPRQRVAKFFQPVIQKIERTLRQQTWDAVKCLILPGGFGRSDYLNRKLGDLFGEDFPIHRQTSLAVGSYQPVVRGALLRYEEIKARGLKPNESFGVATVEPYDRAIHPDATVRNGRAQYDPFDDRQKVVYERWTPLLRQTPAQAEQAPYTTNVWQRHVVKSTEDSMVVQVYTTEVPINAHAAMRDGPDCHSPLLPGIECWGEPLSLSKERIKALGFKTTKSQGEYTGRVYELYWRLRMIFDGANVRAIWSVAQPNAEPVEVDGGWQMDGDALVIANVHLSEEDYNPFARTHF